MEKGWKKQLIEEIKKPYMQELRFFLENERKKNIPIYPEKQEIFAAFDHTPYVSVKAVIVGQDPYHGTGQAHGLAFSVQKEVTPPPSLVNIFKELKSDLDIPIPKHGYLLSWAKQGVLLLNATLTVRQNAPRSHYGKGWELFTDFVIRLLSKRQDPLVFMLWGKSAKEKCKNLVTDSCKHCILTAAHPSPFSAYNGFFGCKHFSKANIFLQKIGKQPIDWSL
jgi:uracil-DNA glycosylase